MAAIARLVERGSVAFDVGGHIGYVALYLAHLVGETGQVHVFEPGPNNISYVRHNILGKPNIILSTAAAGECAGTLPLYLEDLTGQNNSLISDFSTLRENEEAAHVRARRSECHVEVVSLDAYCFAQDRRPGFIKIDVEGFEYEVLRGMQRVLGEVRPLLMIEMQRRQAEVLGSLCQRGYVPFTANGLRVASAAALGTNTFFVPEENQQGLAAMTQGALERRDGETGAGHE
jgi:FkbM family methyltransferase